MRATFDTTEVRALRVRLDSRQDTNVARARLALRKAAKDIERDAKLLVPVDTGALKNSIGTDAIDADHYVIGPTMNYASYVERGTSRQRPQPYMRPAADRHVPRLVAALRQIGGDVL